jgi:hypothetical protein
MNEITLSERLMPAGHEALFSFRQLVLASFAATAHQLWPDVLIRTDVSERTLWRCVRGLVDARPDHAPLLREKHPIVYAWLYGPRQVTR